MKRRDFLTHTTAGVAGATLLGAPAIRADEGQVRWRLASSFPKSLDTIYGAAELLSHRVAALTDGKFQIRVFAGGELVPGLQVLDAVKADTVECGHTASYYYVGKDKAFAFDCAVPFGLTARQQNAWMYSGGGLELTRELFAAHNIINFPGGNTGTQMGGWFRNEVKSLADIKGLKMRIPGLGGEIMSKLGAVAQTIAGGDIYPALERGTIDAAEWVGPYDDEKLGFHKIAKNYYYPGWWEPGPQLSFYINSDEWAKLPKRFQQAFEVAAAEANLSMLTAYDAKNPEALVRLIRTGVKLRKYPDDVMKAAQEATFALYEDEAGKNSAFKRIYVEWQKFRALQHGWFSLAEAGVENFMYANRR